MIDKKVRPLPKRLSETQKIVLATYPYARCGTSAALRETMKDFWSRNGESIFGNFGKYAKWVIYTEPDNPHINLLVNVIGVHHTSQKGAWEDAYKVLNVLMIHKMERS